MKLAMLPSIVRQTNYPNRPTAFKVAAVACFFLVSNTAGTAKAYFSSGGTLSMRQWSHGGNKFISIRDRKDGTIVVSPNDERLQSATIIICHGLGDTAEGWSDVAEVFLLLLLFLLLCCLAFVLGSPCNLKPSFRFFLYSNNIVAIRYSNALR